MNNTAAYSLTFYPSSPIFSSLCLVRTFSLFDVCIYNQGDTLTLAFGFVLAQSKTLQQKRITVQKLVEVD